jgi:hypothetical protein
MTAKRVASAHNPRPTIAAALNDQNLVKRAERLAWAINQDHPDEEPQDVKLVLWIAINLGLEGMEERQRRRVTQ